MNKKAQKSVEEIPSWLIVLFVVIIVIIFLLFVDINKAWSFIPNASDFFNEKDSENLNKNSLDISENSEKNLLEKDKQETNEKKEIEKKDEILEEYNSKKCSLNKYTCAVENECACFNNEQWTSLNSENPLKFDLCSKDELCDNKEKGCVKIFYGSQTTKNCKSIQKSLGNKFVFPNVCEEDKNTLLKNYCSCPNSEEAAYYFRESGEINLGDEQALKNYINKRICRFNQGVLVSKYFGICAPGQYCDFWGQGCVLK